MTPDEARRQLREAMRDARDLQQPHSVITDEQFEADLIVDEDDVVDWQCFRWLNDHWRDKMPRHWAHLVENFVQDHEWWGDRRAHADYPATRYTTFDAATFDLLKCLPGNKIEVGAQWYFHWHSTAEGESASARSTDLTEAVTSFVVQLLEAGVEPRLRWLERDGKRVVPCANGTHYPFEGRSCDECPECGGWLGPLDGKELVAAECSECGAYMTNEKIADQCGWYIDIGNEGTRDRAGQAD